jgi:(E)-4-hydroxy-3-methyl-but-2-enyl pyrophosphate reductase
VNVTVAPGTGFCFGVKRALKIAFDAARKSEGPIVTLGPIIHNPQVVAKLEEEGVRIIQSLDDVAGGTLVVRSHGLPQRVLDQAAAKGMTIVDATCPFVKQVHNCAVQLEREGYAVVVVGEEEHPEVLSIAGSLERPPTVVDGQNGLSKLGQVPKVGIVCQTTQPYEHLRVVAESLLGRTRELRIMNTICEATCERQESALELARTVDVMLVVGGTMSANTRRLWELCREAGCDAYHIETSEGLRPEWFLGKTEVGVTGGASTPHWIVDEVVEAVKRM